MKCRHCGTLLRLPFLDLGFAPPSNAYLSENQLHAPEVYFPLRVLVCEACWLVQTEDYAGAEALFSPDYAYFSSVSQGWLDHARRYVEMITNRLELGPNSFVIEVAANDGYLLKNFVAANIPCLGIEPTDSTAQAAEALGIPILRQFFGRSLAQTLKTKHQQADLIIGNNVYAHVPDINDFTAGLKEALKPNGVITLEFPHLMRLIAECQFDTIYHEHFSYLSLQAVSRIFEAQDLRVFDVEALPTHGGSLRVYGCHKESPRQTAPAVPELLAQEIAFGLQNRALYQQFQARADQVKDNLLAFLIQERQQGRRVAAYGAAAKGNTLLNYAGVKPDLLSFVCDAAPSKQGKFMPGSHIPIRPPSALMEEKPDSVVILPWNIAPEVMRSQAAVRDWGGKFVVAVPELTIFEG